MFYVGQEVVCIVGPDDWVGAPGRLKSDDEILPEKNVVYHIRNIETSHCDGCLYLRLVEIRNTPCSCHGIEPQFESIGFRPVVKRKTDISIFKKLLNPKSAKKRENA